MIMYRKSTLAGPPSCPGIGDHFSSPSRSLPYDGGMAKFHAVRPLHLLVVSLQPPGCALPFYVFPRKLRLVQ